jgi:predicted  nucleic acid-binding Zn-ribbon protein
VYQRDKLPSAVLSEVTDLFTDVASTQDDIPYFCICKALIEILSRSNANAKTHQDKLKEVSAAHQAELERHQTEYAELQQKLDKLSGELKPKKTRVREIQAELIQTQANLDKTVLKLIHKETEVRDIRRALDEEHEAFISLTRKLKELKQHVSKLTEDNTKLKREGLEMRLSVQSTTDNFATALIRLKQIQTSHSSLAEEIRLKDELFQDLNVRAAIAFGDFTPRPSLGDIAAELGVELIGKLSTVDKCDKIFSVVKRKRRLTSKLPIPKLVENPGCELGQAESQSFVSMDRTPPLIFG